MKETQTTTWSLPQGCAILICYSTVTKKMTANSNILKRETTLDYSLWKLLKRNALFAKWKF